VSENVIVRTVSRVMIPFILCFALYVIAFGEAGPGGGFQGGCIVGAAVALYGLVWGRDAAAKRIPQRLMDALCGIGVMVYGGTGFVCLLLGGNMLEYQKLAVVFHTTQHGNHMGIFFIEMGVAITVSAVMITLFFEVTRPPAPGDAAAPPGTGEGR
jgi:multicomponent Na+:H+ antiporter subunit B